MPNWILKAIYSLVPAYCSSKIICHSIHTHSLPVSQILTALLLVHIVLSYRNVLLFVPTWINCLVLLNLSGPSLVKCFLTLPSLSQYFHLFIFKKNFFQRLFIYLGQRETEYERGRGRERGRHRIGNRLQALSHQPRA